MLNHETKLRMERARKLNKEIRDDDARFHRKNESLEKRLMRERCYLAIAAKRGVSVETVRRQMGGLRTAAFSTSERRDFDGLIPAETRAKPGPLGGNVELRGSYFAGGGRPDNDQTVITIDEVNRRFVVSQPGSRDASADSVGI